MDKLVIVAILCIVGLLMLGAMYLNNQHSITGGFTEPLGKEVKVSTQNFLDTNIQANPDYVEKQELVITRD